MMQLTGPHSRRTQRILYVITDLDVGGAEKCCAQLAMGLNRERWHAAVCSLSPVGAMADRLVQAGVEVHSLGVRSVREAPQAVSRLARLVRRFRPAIAHTFLFHANVVGRVAGWMAGTPHIVSSIRVAERRFRSHLIIENLTCRLSERVTCVSGAVARFTRRHSHVPSGRLTVIPNGIDLHADRDSEPVDRGQLGMPAPGVVALFVGRLDAQKGVDTLLHALGPARGRCGDLHVVLVGAGAERAALERLARELDLTPYVHFLGWRDDVRAIMRAADFLVLPSRWEGMSNAVLEAMAEGLPVIATRAEGSAELVRHDETGILVEIDEPDALASAMAMLGLDSEKRVQYGRAGRERVCREFSLERMIDRHTELYESLLR
jgi:glycosyltransferase involved in cell wall biosynthesis